MLTLVTLFITLGAAAIPAIIAARLISLRRWQADLVAYELRFPYDLEPAAVTIFLGSLSGLVARRPWHQFVVRAVVIEITATPGQIRHHLLVPRHQADTVLSQLRAALPSVTARPDPDHTATRATLAGELTLPHPERALRTDHPTATAHSLLASLQPLDPNERIQHRATIARVWSEELPGLMLYYNLNAAPHLAILTGPTLPAPESMGYIGWNIHEWDMR